MANMHNPIKHIMRDIKANGFIYLKSAIVAEQIKAADKNISVEYNKEEGHYIATYIK